MGERLLCKQEVIGSIPFTSTSLRCSAASAGKPEKGGLPAVAAKRQRGAAEFKRERIQSALALGFRTRAVSIFNNSEEAKRIDSARISAEAMSGCDCIFFELSAFENGERGRVYPRRRSARSGGRVIGSSD